MFKEITKRELPRMFVGKMYLSLPLKGKRISGFEENCRAIVIRTDTVQGFLLF